MKKNNRRKTSSKKKSKRRKRQYHWRGRQSKWQKRLKIAVLILVTLLGILAVLAKAYHFFAIHTK
ncbi:hypothetical protein CA264_21050 (plasmid) [Pontibacter actiniarum]|uniref:Uncharacterized protein n=1 Tax=Pontibacter actiniarum TaxID=323450 RepID=A0A1X9YZ36_9BACT|nr:hypothetical protein CA264_21050 [Pontibacter actiniarum]